MHEHAAIAFEHEKARGQRQVRAEAARVVDGATSNDETHVFEGSPRGRPECSLRVAAEEGRPEQPQGRSVGSEVQIDQ